MIPSSWPAPPQHSLTLGAPPRAPRPRPGTDPNPSYRAGRGEPELSDRNWDMGKGKRGAEDSRNVLSQCFHKLLFQS